MSMNTKRISTTILTAILAWVFLCISAAHAEGWRRITDMPLAVTDFSMVALSEGAALAPGGSPGTDRTQIYDVTSDSWTLTGRMTTRRGFHAVARLQDNQVLVSGGTFGSPIRSAEIFDPCSGMWTLTGSMDIPRISFTLTTLLDGTVLAAGGRTVPSVVTNRVELFDPSTGEWTEATQMGLPRSHHTATLLNDGTVLVVGGNRLDRQSEVYDPGTGTWTDGGRTVGLHFVDHTATLLQDGRVLVVGGIGAPDTAEIFDPATRTWTLVGSTLEWRIGHVSALLFDGTVLVAGGFVGGIVGETVPQLRSTEIFDPGTETWRPAEPMQFGRSFFSGVALETDSDQSRVLVGGGVTSITCFDGGDIGVYCGDLLTRTSEVYEVP